MEIILRKEALAKNLPRYFTNKPCKQGHLAERTTIKSTCIICLNVCRQVWKEHNGLNYGRVYRKSHRQAAINKLGGRCAKCGIQDLRTLQIDHIDGGGTQERISNSRSAENAIVRDDDQNKYQLLCANCNWIKRHENKEHNKYKSDKTNKYVKNKRLEVIKALDGECKHCKVKDTRVLQIDHINGGGCKERKLFTNSYSFHNHVLTCLKNYQLLCANCNWIKRVKNKEHP
jgi:hypothetical protein